MKKFLMVVGLAMLAFQFCLTFSCKPELKRELIMLDSLDQLLAQTKKNIEIDVPTIKARRMEIESNINLIKRYNTDTISHELGNNLQKYTGVMKIYKQFLNNFGIVNNEAVELEKQVTTLRNSVRDHKITKEEFRIYYDRERFDIVTNLELSERSGKIVFEIEPEYQRLNREISAVLKRIAAKNEELREILK
jgi:hypothetical protein